MHGEQNPRSESIFAKQDASPSPTVPTVSTAKKTRVPQHPRLSDESRDPPALYAVLGP